ncbi:MAG: hypothetical protein J0H30_10855 [Alphaproteobacteria bacterium]|nr:hypothetical protein [Alphaproteobacteria bacterium]
MRNYMVRIGAEMSANLPDAAFAEFLAGAEADKRAFAEHPDWTSAASYRLSATALYRDVTRTLVARHRMKEQLTAFYASGFDAILMPITPVPAFRHSQSESFMDRHIEIEGRTWPFLTMVNWISLATFLHAPAIAVPAGRTGDGLPVGVQLVGTWNGEDRLFDFAAALEETLGGFTKPAL